MFCDDLLRNPYLDLNDKIYCLQETNVQLNSIRAIHHSIYQMSWDVFQTEKLKG